MNIMPLLILINSNTQFNKKHVTELGPHFSNPLCLVRLFSCLDKMSISAEQSAQNCCESLCYDFTDCVVRMLARLLHYTRFINYFTVNSST